MKSDIRFSIQVPRIGARIDGTAFLKACVVSGVGTSPPGIYRRLEFLRFAMAVGLIRERRLSKQRAASRRYRERKRAEVRVAVPSDDTFVRIEPGPNGGIEAQVAII